MKVVEPIKSKKNIKRLESYLQKKNERNFCYLLWELTLD